MAGSDRSMGGFMKTSTAVVRTMNQDALEMLEYPFITMQQYPPGFVVHIGKLCASSKHKFNNKYCFIISCKNNGREHFEEGIKYICVIL